MNKYILCTNSKGGVGKSTLSLNLAITLSEEFKVAVIDLDHQGSLILLKNQYTKFNITNEQYLLYPNQEYDIIIIDCPPYLQKDLPKLIRLADLIIIPTRAGILDVLAMSGTVHLIEKEKMKYKSLIVLNMIKHNTTLTEEVLNFMVAHKIKIAKTRLSDLVSFTRSVALKGVFNDKKAQRQIDNLTLEVKNLLN